MINSYPKIFAIGTDYIKDIFDGDVEVTEKIDGSQFAFGKVNGELLMRSKGARLDLQSPNKMFTQGVEYVKSVEDKLPDNMIFYSEYLKSPRHNALEYNRIPTNHIMLYGVMDHTQKFHNGLQDYATLLGIECVPILYVGKISSSSDLVRMMHKESVLGGSAMEGVVVKNYFKPFLLGGQPIPIMAGKYVSEGFKEVHKNKWGYADVGKSKLDTFFESFKTEARWNKAVQHLADSGQLDNSPKDIGKLFKEVSIDIEAEEKEAVKEWLWKEFQGKLNKKATEGLPEWYKKSLMERSF